MSDKGGDVPPPSEPSFIVGVGASAGGLEALRDFFGNLPDPATSPSPATFVVVQHMSPAHRSLLSTLIARETRLPVHDLEDGAEPETGAIYVTPPNVDVLYREGRLRLAPSSGGGAPKPSIDRFFLSLAESAQDRSVGIVLSGTGSDGAFGIRAVRGAGGVTIAQEPRSAKYDGMPQAAIETGCVDLVLSPADMGAKLSRIIASPRDLERFRTPAGPETPLAELLQIVFARSRVDFRDYKPTTIQRRLDRRMTALGVEEMADYVALCRRNPEEVDALFRDFLVSVTWFFRDPQEFLALVPLVKEIVERRRSRPARVWIAGCATGEEAYSVAILFAEALGGPEKLKKDKVQIFASDVDARALEAARRGQYPRAALENVPADYVDRYFRIDGDNVNVHPALKDVVIFSYHNACQDPPFINIDLICCRNLLIYFSQQLQARVLSRFAYALDPAGAMLLGTAETVTVSEEHFVRSSPGAHLFRRRAVGRRAPRGGYEMPPPFRPGGTREMVSEATTAEAALFDAVARALGPVVALATEDCRILRIWGDLSPYVKVDETTRLQLGLAILRHPLAQEARTLVGVALRSGERRQGAPHRIFENQAETIRLEAFPLVQPGERERLALLVFNRHVEAAPRRPQGNKEGGEWLETVERELASTRQALEQTIEALETSNEELQSANEELQSTNEELQATNEELETSNEELQSSNEELVTVNEELQISSSELATINEELNTVLKNVAAPLLIVDSALQITKASRDAILLFRLEPPLETPHLSQCALPDGFPLLVEIANEALQFGRTVTREFTAGGLFHILRCAPVSTPRGRLQGVTMCFMATPGAAAR